MLRSAARFRPLEPGDVAYLADHLREADRQELTASHGADARYADLIELAVLRSSHVWVLGDEVPIAIFGVAPISLVSGIGSPWLLGTARLFDYPRTLVTEGRHYISRMRALYSTLYNYVDARNDKSIRWLEHMGFTVHEAVPHGVAGEPFHRFDMGAE